jgi:hypothetical protein
MVAFVIAVALVVFPSMRPPRFWTCVADETQRTQASLGCAAARRLAQQSCLELAKTNRQAYAARVGLRTAAKPAVNESKKDRGPNQPPAKARNANTAPDR